MESKNKKTKQINMYISVKIKESCFIILPAVISFEFDILCRFFPLRNLPYSLENMESVFKSNSNLLFFFFLDL